MIALNKPFNVMCQFSAVDGRSTLADFVRQTDVYPAGRLDYDSEGLLLLTDDGGLAHRLTDPKHKQPKTYLVQVEGIPDDVALNTLRRGVMLNDGMTLPIGVEALESAPEWLWPRDPPVRFRKTVPDAWLRLTLREGRNRQVRRMTAAVGLPTLRLVREEVGGHALAGLQPGETRVLDATPARRRR
nr:pseudouridine synthase [Luteibacter sp. Sphag1AF]